MIPAVPGPARALAAVAAGSVVAGVLAGVVWGVVAPGERLFVVDEQHVLPLDLDSNNVFVAIALFALFSALAGVLCGALAWAWRATRGPAMGLAVIAGGLAGAWLGALAGEAVASARLGWPADDNLAGLVGQAVSHPPAVGLWVALIGQGLAAGVVYIVAATLSAESDLGVAGSHGRAQHGELVGHPQA